MAEEQEVVEVFIDPSLRGSYTEKATISILERKPENEGKIVKAVYEQKPPEEKPEEKPIEEKHIEEEKPAEEIIKPEEQQVNIFSKFGDDVDTVDKAFEKYQKELSEKEGISKKLKELEDKGNDDPFANDKIRKLNQIAKKTGRDDTEVLHKLVAIDIDNADPIELLILQKQIDNPKMNVEFAKIRIEREYQYEYEGKKYSVSEKPEDFEELSETEQSKINLEVALLQDKLKDDTVSVRTKFKEFVTVTDVPASNRAEEMAAKMELVTPVVTEMIVATKVPITLPKYKDLAIEFDFSQEMLEPYREGLTQHLLQESNPTQKTLEQARNTMFRLAIADNFEGILEAAVDKAIAINHAKKLEEAVNPDGTKKEIIPTTPKPKSAIEEYLEKQKSQKTFV